MNEIYVLWRGKVSEWGLVPRVCILVIVCVLGELGAVESNELATLSKDLVESDVRALVELSTYRGDLPPVAKSEVGEINSGRALVAVRTPLRGIDAERLDRLGAHMVSSVKIPGLSLVTLSDLNVTSKEAKRGGANPGQMLDFNENQTVVNAAIDRGLAFVLFVDVLQLSAKRSSISGADKLNLMNARASLTLVNAAEGVRVKTASRDVNVRGFDGANLEERAFDVLARDLSSEVSGWRIPASEIKLTTLEIHAKIDGVSFPMIDLSSPVDQVRLSEVPVFAEDASVEIDGILKGKAPCRVNVSPGTHRLRVYREGTQDFTAVIQVKESARYDALLVPTQEFKRRFERIREVAMQRKVELEAAGARVETMMVRNANERESGRAQADLIQSRADSIRITAESNAASAVARSQVAVSDAGARAKIADGSAAILQEKARTEVVRANADAEVKTANADAVRQRAEGQLAVDRATAKNMGSIMKIRNEMLQVQVDAFRSFAEKLGGLAFRVGRPVGQ
jgi:hypothetical protein